MPTHSTDRAPSVRFLHATLHRTETKTRMPFRFGIAVMAEAPHVFLHCSYEIDGKISTGVAAEGLLPRWFDKTPDKNAEQEIDEMLLVIRRAVAFSSELTPSSAFSDAITCAFDDMICDLAACNCPQLCSTFTRT